MPSAFREADGARIGCDGLCVDVETLRSAVPLSAILGAARRAARSRKRLIGDAFR